MQESVVRLSDAIQRKNLVDEEIARLIERPCERGHVGEYIASAIFEIALELQANAKHIDGRFISGELAGRTVNIKWYGKKENILDIATQGSPDYYLVMTGPKSPAASSRGTTRPWIITQIFLFDANKLVEKLKQSGVKLGVAAGVRNSLWIDAEVYPEAKNPTLRLTDAQRKILALFG